MLSVFKKSEIIGKTQKRKASFSKIKSHLATGNIGGIIREGAALLTGKQIEEPIDMSYEITFPELLTEDRSAKLKDISLCETKGWFSSELSGNLAGREMGVTTYNWDDEQEKRHAEAKADPLVQAMFQTDAGIKPDVPGAPGTPGQPGEPDKEPPKPGSSVDVNRYQKSARRK